MLDLLKNLIEAKPRPHLRRDGPFPFGKKSSEVDLKWSEVDLKSSEVNLKSSEVDLKSSEVGGGRSLKLRVSTKKETRLFFSYDFQIFIFGEKFTSPTRNDDRGGNFFSKVGLGWLKMVWNA